MLDMTNTYPDMTDDTLHIYRILTSTEHQDQPDDSTKDQIDNSALAAPHRTIVTEMLIITKIPRAEASDSIHDSLPDVKHYTIRNTANTRCLGSFQTTRPALHFLTIYCWKYSLKEGK